MLSISSWASVPWVHLGHQKLICFYTPLWLNAGGPKCGPVCHIMVIYEKLFFKTQILIMLYIKQWSVSGLTDYTLQEQSPRKFWLLRQSFLINHKEQLIYTLSLSFLSLLYPCQPLHVYVLSFYFSISPSLVHTILSSSFLTMLYCVPFLDFSSPTAWTWNVW